MRLYIALCIQLDRLGIEVGPKTNECAGQGDDEGETEGERENENEEKFYHGYHDGGGCGRG